MVLGERLGLLDNAFAGSTAVEVLSPNHAPPDSFDELVRCTRPGGSIIFSVRSEAREFRVRQNTLERDNQWKLVEAAEPLVSLHLGDPDLKNRVFVCQVV